MSQLDSMLGELETLAGTQVSNTEQGTWWLEQAETTDPDMAEGWCRSGHVIQVDDMLLYCDSQSWSGWRAITKEGNTWSPKGIRQLWNGRATLYAIDEIAGHARGLRAISMTNVVHSVLLRAGYTISGSQRCYWYAAGHLVTQHVGSIDIHLAYAVGPGQLVDKMDLGFCPGVYLHPHKRGRLGRLRAYLETQSHGA